MTTISLPQIIEVYTFGIYTFTLDLDRMTVKISRTAKTRSGSKVISYLGFNNKPNQTAEEKIANMQLHVNNFMTKVELNKAEEQAEKAMIIEAKKTAPSKYSVGEILYHTYGYDQTNVQFFQIVAIKGLKVTLREICQKANGYDSGTTMPLKDEFRGEEITKMIQVNVWSGSVNIRINDAAKWDGTPRSWSSGH